RTRSVDLSGVRSCDLPWTITDLCDTTEVTATYTLTPAPDVTYTEPVDETDAACEFTNQAGVDAAIAAWVAAQDALINAAGGCDPQVTNDYTTQSVDLCAGGSFDITWTITDLCDTT